MLNHGTLKHALLIPITLHYHATELRQRFTSELPPPTAEFALDEEPSSVTELLSQFLALATHQVTEGEDDAQGTYEEVLRLVLTELESLFLRGNEVHAVVAQLPGTPAKRLDVVSRHSLHRGNPPP